MRLEGAQASSASRTEAAETIRAATLQNGGD
jgi:hypothetical protein